MNSADMRHVSHTVAGIVHLVKYLQQEPAADDQQGRQWDDPGDENHAHALAREKHQVRGEHTALSRRRRPGWGYSGQRRRWRRAGPLWQPRRTTGRRPGICRDPCAVFHAIAEDPQVKHIAKQSCHPAAVKEHGGEDGDPLKPRICWSGNRRACNDDL